MASGKNRPPPSAFRPVGKSIFRPFSGKKVGKLFSASFPPFFREKGRKIDFPPSGKVQKNSHIFFYFFWGYFFSICYYLLVYSLSDPILMFKHESVRLGRVGSGWVGRAGQVGSGSSGWSGRLSRSGRSLV